MESPRCVPSWFKSLRWHTEACCKLTAILKSNDDFQCSYSAVMMQRMGVSDPEKSHVLFLPPHTSLAVWLTLTTLSCLLDLVYWNCVLWKQDNSSFSSVPLCIFPLLPSLSALAWHFNREFWNLAAGFPWKTLMEKAVVGAFDGRVWFYTARQAKHVPLSTTFVLPSSVWMAFQYGRQGQGERTHTGPNLNYKATLQATCLTLLPPSFFYVHCHCYLICLLSSFCLFYICLSHYCC